jgi:hypothetical protein
MPRTELLAKAERIPGLHGVRLQMENEAQSFTLVADVAHRQERPDGALGAASEPVAAAGAVAQ